MVDFGNPEAAEAMNIEGPIGKRRGVVVFYLLVEFMKGISKVPSLLPCQQGQATNSKGAERKAKGSKGKMK